MSTTAATPIAATPTARRRLARAIFFALFTAGLIAIAAFWWTANINAAVLSLPGGRLIAIGRLLGLLAGYAIALEIILSSRIPLIERHFDLQEIIDLHRLSGYAVLTGIAGHLGYLLFGYMAMSRQTLIAQFVTFNTDFDDVLIATIGTVIFIIAVAISIKIARARLRYELWYVAHLTMYAAIILTFLHQTKDGGSFTNSPAFVAYWWALYIAVFALWLWYRVLRQIVTFVRHDFRIKSIVKENDSTWSIIITGKNIGRFTFEPGRYAQWRFLASKHWAEAHPFSLSVRTADTLRFTVKAEGDYSGRISELRPGTPVLIDGPRGSFGAERAATANTVVMVAGGIGVAPFMATIPTLLDQGKKVALLYSVKNPADEAFTAELTALTKRGLALTRYHTATGPRVAAEDVTAITAGNPSAIIYICGPAAMSHALAKALRLAGIPKSRVITEDFAY